MGAGRNANIGRNAGWYRLVFGQASFLDGLLSPMGSGCWGGVPEPHLWNCYRKLESGPPHLLLFRRQKAVRRLMLSAFGVAQALLLICDCFRIYLRFGR